MGSSYNEQRCNAARSAWMAMLYENKSQERPFSTAADNNLEAWSHAWPREQALAKVLKVLRWRKAMVKARIMSLFYHDLWKIFLSSVTISVFYVATIPSMFSLCSLIFHQASELLLQGVVLATPLTAPVQTAILLWKSLERLQNELIRVPRHSW